MGLDREGLMIFGGGRTGAGGVRRIRRREGKDGGEGEGLRMEDMVVWRGGGGSGGLGNGEEMGRE